jgi:hypothetical protein
VKNTQNQKKKDDLLKVKGTLEDLIKVAVSGNPRPKPKNKKKDKK